MSSILLLGLESSGKTSFIAALWHALQFGVPGQTALTLHDLAGDRTYINEIHDRWTACRGFEGLVVNEIEPVQINLTGVTGFKKANLQVFDVDGEVFESQWLTRAIEQNFQPFQRNNTLVIVFVNPKSIRAPQTIHDSVAMTKALDPGFEPAKTESPISDSERPPQWDAKKTPSQVKLVELMQFYRKAEILTPGTKTAVVVSAWETIAMAGNKNDTPLKPRDFVKKLMPLLYQYLIANYRSKQIAFFGISSQGGDYAKKKSELLNITPQIERILVNIDGNTNHDPTRILQWLIQ